jgi:hypothetical protein
MMAVVELEAGMISARTKVALAASKARGNQLEACEVVPAPQKTPPELAPRGR